MKGKIHKIHMTCRRQGQEIQIDIADEGAGIEKIENATEPLYTTRPDKDRSGMGFTFMETFMDQVTVESGLEKAQSCT